MKITRIDLAGETDNFAILMRKTGSNYIDVEVLLACTSEEGRTEGYGSRKHHVLADDPDDQQSMAECLQQTLDGYEGTRGDVAVYCRTLQMLAD